MVDENRLLENDRSEGFVRIANIRIQIQRSKKLCNWKKLFFCLLSVFAVVVILVLIFFLYYYDFQSNFSTYSSQRYWLYSHDTAIEFAEKNFKFKQFETGKHARYVPNNLSFDTIRRYQNARFNIFDDDVIVFLHIQKTAGSTFERYLVRNLKLPRPCECIRKKKRCRCLRPTAREETVGADITNLVASELKSEDRRLWLFSRFSTGWSCGLHADWTELVVSNCVDSQLDIKEGAKRKRRYFYTTFLREPSARYISEYRHVARGATWLASKHFCNGRLPTSKELPMCFDPVDGWMNVSLDEFLDCPFNLANNRQTRMLSDLTLVHCYNLTAMPADQRDAVMLQSAKRNLEGMAFFGLQEEMRKSQFIFEKTFNLNFTLPMDNDQFSKSADTPLTVKQLKKVMDKNHLDIQLYKFAVELFEKRLSYLKKEDDSSNFSE